MVCLNKNFAYKLVLKKVQGNSNEITFLILIKKNNKLVKKVGIIKYYNNLIKNIDVDLDIDVVCFYLSKGLFIPFKLYNYFYYFIFSRL